MGAVLLLMLLGLVFTAHYFQSIPDSSWRLKEGWNALRDLLVLPQLWVEHYSVLERSWLIQFDNYNA